MFVDDINVFDCHLSGASLVGNFSYDLLNDSYIIRMDKSMYQNSHFVNSTVIKS